MTLLQHHILALFLTAITTFVLGLLVFIADPRRRLNQVFWIYSLAISGWGVTESFMIASPNQQVASFWAYLLWPCVILIAPTFIHTVFLVIGKQRHIHNIILGFSYAASFIFLLLHLFANLISEKYPIRVGYIPFRSVLTPAGALLPLTFLVLVNVGLWNLWGAYKHATGRQKIQLTYLFWGSVIGYLGGSLDWLFTFKTYIPFLNPFGIYGVPCYSIATTYAILHHRLFDVNLVIRKSLVYSILVTLLTAGYFALVYGVEQLFQVAFGYQSRWLSLAAFALMALLFQPLKIGIQHLVDWLIFRAPQHELVRRLENLEREARKTERLKAVTTLAAGLCHELRNPLQTIRTHAEFLPERYDDPAFRKRCAEVMKTEIGRIDEFLKQLMEFAKPKASAFRQVELHKILDSTLDLLSNEFLKRRIHLDRQYQANGARLHGDPDQLRQVILNLIVNALEAIGQEGKIFVKTSQENGWFTLEVADTGPGIDPKILPKLFEPFITTKPDGNGLGLSIVHDIVREHRGKISVQSHPGQNTTFTITLPVS